MSNDEAESIRWWSQKEAEKSEASLACHPIIKASYLTTLGDGVAKEPYNVAKGA